MRTALYCVALLGGCASLPPPEPVIIKVPVTVEVPVRVACLRNEDRPVVPAITPNERALRLTDRNLVLLLEEEREVLAAYAMRADALLGACVEPGP
jgi:hypothetical protein